MQTVRLIYLLNSNLVPSSQGLSSSLSRVPGLEKVRDPMNDIDVTNGKLIREQRHLQWFRLRDTDTVNFHFGMTPWKKWSSLCVCSIICRRRSSFLKSSLCFITGSFVHQASSLWKMHEASYTQLSYSPQNYKFILSYYQCNIIYATQHVKFRATTKLKL